MNSIFTNARNFKNFHATILTSSARKSLLTVFIFLLGFLSITPGSVKAQALGDYRSIITTGLPVVNSWENSTTWERYNGASWVGASAAPNFNDGVITVRSPTYIKINGNLTLDQTIVENGATIQPSAAGATLTINNGAGTDLQLNGTNGTVWANNHLLNVTNGALIDGPIIYQS